MAWALAPPAGGAEPFPGAPLLVGTVAPAQTLSSLVLFVAYAAVYYLVVHHVHERRELRRLTLLLLAAGTVFAFGGIIDHLSGTSWVFTWREPGITGRVAASFPNPDHFAAWLAMLICLGGGYVMSARRPRRGGWSARAFVTEPEAREAMIRWSLPLLPIVVMVLALLFTLSRGALAGTVAGALVFVACLRMTKRGRASFLGIGVLAAIALAYGAWLGLSPLLRQVGASASDLVRRLEQYQASASMLREFPLLGVGLGAYKDIYPRYQPVTHVDAYHPYAHSDVLQLVIETGIPGGVVLAWALWRVVRDFVGAHYLGRAACPVGAGAGDDARRRDPQSTALAAGGLAALVALLVHCVVDFPLRIPANGFLAAAVLGVVTVALHTRFGVRDAFMLSPRQADVLLSSVREVTIPPGRARRAVSVVGGVVAVATVAYTAHAAVVDGRLAARRAAPGRATTDAILSIDGGNPRGLAARGALRLDDAVAASWRPGARERARTMLDSAAEDFRAAVRATPTWARPQERLAATFAARVATDRTPGDVAAALAHYRRAIALTPADASLHLALFRFAFAQRPALLDTALAAAQDAIRRDPRTVEAVVETAAPAGLSESRWLALAPATAHGRLLVALALERSALIAPATSLARAARDVATTAPEDAAARWLLARLLLLKPDVDEAAQEIAAALARHPGNPEIHLAHAEILRARGDLRCLDAYRDAIAAAATGLRRAPDGRRMAFDVADARLRAVITERAAASPLKYRMALGTYLTSVGLWQLALREMTDVVAQHGDHAPARFMLGTVLDGVGEADRALEEYRRAVALDGRAAFRSRLAQRLWDTRQYYQAIAEWRAIGDREPGNIDARLALARALAHVGDRSGAIGAYEAALALDKTNVLARRELHALTQAQR